jgi:single-strand DNA-binding protein
MYSTSGKLKWIGEVQSFPSGFTKREFVVTTATDKYPQDLKFEIVKDKCSLLDPFAVGQDVEVNFDIRGNEYNGKYFVNLSCWKIQAAGADGTAPPQPRQSGHGKAPASAEPSADDLRSDGDFDDEPPF